MYCAVFGVTSGAYVGLTSVVLTDLLGLDKLTNSFGLILFFQGIASVMGPPVIGKYGVIHLTVFTRGREPQSPMSLRYGDTSLPDFLGRPSLHYADRVSAMQ